MKYDRESLRERIGQALQRYRTQILKDSISEVARKCSSPVSVATVSKIESGEGTLHLETLCNIIWNGYKIDPPILFLHDHNPFFNLARAGASDQIIHIHKDSPYQEIEPPASQKNIVYEDTLKGAKMRFRRLILEPGQDSKEFTFHEGEEFAYIEEGTDVRFIFKNYGVRALEKGDIIHFGPGLVHKAANESKEIAAKILILSSTE